MIQGPYHLFSTGVLLILSYFISLLLVRMQILQKPGHRKFWNTLMLIFFVSTAALGLLLVVKVNYKLDLSWLDSLMLWHVDLGIGFALVAVFHLSWHLKYYRRTNPDQHGPDQHSPGQLPWTAHISFTPLQGKLFFLLLGYVSIMAQLVLLREFVKTLHGNELFLGIFLALWMVMTAAGSQIGSKSKAKITLRRLLATLLFMGSFPLLIYLALLLVTRWFFLPGIEPGMLVVEALPGQGWYTKILAPVLRDEGELYAEKLRAAEVRPRRGEYLLDLGVGGAGVHPLVGLPGEGQDPGEGGPVAALRGVDDLHHRHVGNCFENVFLAGSHCLDS